MAILPNQQEDSLTMTYEHRIPAQLIVNGQTYDVMVESISYKTSKYHYDGSYWDNDKKCFCCGEETITETYVCTRVVNELCYC